MLWRSAHFWGSALNVRQQSRRLLIAFSKSPWATGIRRVLAALFLLVLATLMSPAFAAAPPATPVYALGIPHVQHEWVILANLFLLLTGFAILSRHFEESRIPDGMPALLPDDWKGGLALLAVVFVLSGFLDNIAAALIGGTMARHVFQGRVHIATLPRLLLHPMLAVRAASLATLRPR
jgi:Na+/H+ antiporter NhaD/arsenite permease-like protein